MRSAEYLHRYMGLFAVPVVAGVNVLLEAQGRIDKGNAYLWRTEPKYLQAESHT